MWGNFMETVKPSKRIMAFLLDVLLVFFLASLVTSIHFINPYYKKYEKSFEEYSEVTNNYLAEKISEEEFLKLNYVNYYNVSRFSVPYNIAIVVILILYFAIFQKFNNGQTIGKQIMKLKVVNNSDDKDVSLLKYLLRSLPIYYISIGSIIPLLLNSLILLFLKGKVFYIVSACINYTFVILGVVTLVMMLTRKDKRGLHDLIAGTKVIEIK